MDINKIKKISDSEWNVMNIIWESKRITSQEVVRKLEGKTKWREKTIKTLIKRLTEKGAVGYEKSVKDKRVYYYYPIVDKENCIKEETNSFLKRFYNGTLASMVSKFVEKDELSNEEINELIDILNKKKS